MAGQAKRYRPEEQKPFLFRGLMLYILPLPLIPATVSALLVGEPRYALARAAGLAACLVAATLIRRGMQLDIEARRRRLRRRASTVPYRMIGAGVLSAGMFVLAWLGIYPGYGLVSSALLGAAVFAACYLYYGFDPAKQDPQIAAVGITTEEIVELLDEAEGRISAIETASQDINNQEFRDRLRRIVKEARAVLDTIERDPVDARRARKFLKVYLDGARQVTEGYARTHRQGGTPQLEDNFRRVLTTIETVIAEQQDKLRENNLNDLDITIEVLQLQMEKEGVT